MKKTKSKANIEMQELIEAHEKALSICDPVEFRCRERILLLTLSEYLIKRDK
jgi:hypothetical protein